MSTIIIDIETGALSPEQLKGMEPDFSAPSNYKDQAKIDAYIADKRKEWAESAALDATSGKVLALGWTFNDSMFAEDGDLYVACTGSEKDDLTQFWEAVAPGGYLRSRVVGFSSNSFDLPFVVRRSWALGVVVPEAFRTGNKWLPNECVDLLDIWRLGNRQDSISLDRLSRFLGVGAKIGHGKDFAALLAKDPEKAIAYLKQDVLLTKGCAKKLGVI